QALTRQHGQAVAGARVLERVRAVLRSEAEVHVQPASTPGGDRAPDERGQVSAPGRDLLDQETDQESVVGGREGIAVPDVHLELGDVVLASPALHLELAIAC